MEEHVVVKYPSENYNSEGIYTKEEWTSFCDIGKTYDGVLFSYEEYLKVENQYIGFLNQLLVCSDCKYLSIDIFSRVHEREVVRKIKKFCKLDAAFEGRKCISLVKDLRVRKRFSVDSVLLLMRLCMREALDVAFVNKKKIIEMYFGFDLYLHISSPLELHFLREVAQKNNLFVDPRPTRILVFSDEDAEV